MAKIQVLQEGSRLQTEIWEVKVKMKNRRNKEAIKNLQTAIRKETERYSKLKMKITLRQLFYRLVPNVLQNTVSEYKFLSRKMVEWRKQGVFNGILVDKTRVFHNYIPNETTLIQEINSIISIIESGRDINPMAFQNVYIEVWVEKQALEEIFSKVCREKYLNLQICRGYNSYTFIKKAIQRFSNISEDIKKVIQYYGDFDPTGIDIFRHLSEELQDLDIEIQQIALTKKQAEDLKLESAPTKDQDSRSKKFLETNENETYELDSIDPIYLMELIKTSAEKLIDNDLIAEIENKRNKTNQIFHSYLFKRLKKWLENQ